MRKLRKIQSFAVLAALAGALFANVAMASLIVSGTTASGELGVIGPGDYLRPTVTVTPGTSGVDFSIISVWDFRLDWGSAPLDFDESESSITVLGGTNAGTYSLAAFESLIDTDNNGPDGFGPTWFSQEAAGRYEISWLANAIDLTGSFFYPFDFGNGFTFEAAFTFTGTAAGTFPITFAPDLINSQLTDDWFVSDAYAATSAGQDPMQVVITPRAQGQAPAPGAVALLAIGLVSLGVATRRSRRN